MKQIQKIIVVAVFTFFSLSSFAQTWKQDPMHARLGFVVSRNAMLDVTGVFKNFDITLNASKPDFSDAKISVEIETASVDTYVEMRDNHLKGDGFLDVAKYPKMTFVSTSVKPVSKNTLAVTGNLTLHGVTKPVTLTLQHLGTTRDERSKKDVAGFKVTGTFKRADFGVGANLPAPLIGEDVNIVVDALMQK